MFAQRRRQHGHSALHEIHAGSPLASVAIKGSVGLHEVGHVCDMNTDIISSIFVQFHGEAIVQIFGGFRINAENTVLSKVLANFIFPFGDPVLVVNTNAINKHSLTHVHGVGGRHLRTLSVKSSVGKLQSFSKALVSTSISPMGPSSSTKVPKGWRELMGCAKLDVSSVLIRTTYITYVTLDASDKEFVDIGLRVLNEIGRCLLSRDGYQRHTLIGGLEPDDLGTLDRSTTGFIATVTFTFSTLGFLLFLGGSR